MSRNGFLNRSMIGLPIVGGNAVSFGWGGPGLFFRVVVCLAGEVEISAVHAGTVLLVALATGPVTNEAQVSAPVEIDNAAMSGPVEMDALFTGPVTNEARVSAPVEIDDASMSGPVEVVALLSGLVTDEVTTVPVEIDGAIVTGPVGTEARFTGPVLKSC